MTAKHLISPARPRDTDPGSASARAEALLRATNEFLRSEDLPALGRAVTKAILAMFGDAKAAVTLAQPDGTAVLMSTAGLSPGEVERLGDLVEPGTNLSPAVLGGTEVWSDDPGAGELRELIAAWGGQSGLTVPIRTTAGVSGHFSMMFADQRSFDLLFRDSVRSLAAQAGLAHELIAAREHLRQAALDADAQRRVATAFYAVASSLALVTEPGVVPKELVAAIRAATGATTAAVALRKDDSEEFVIAAVEGVSPEQAAILAATPMTPEHFPSLRALLDGSALAGSERSVATTRLDLGGGAAAPIILDGTVRGFLSMTVSPGDTFDAVSWQELAKGFASVAATALARVEAVASLKAERAVLASTVAERTVQLRALVTELGSANQAKTDFLANVSHELRTPMTAILGFSEVLVGGDDGPLNPRQHEDATTILSSSRRLLELIDDLIDISRIESNRLELEIQPVPLQALLTTVVEELRALAGAKGLGLTFKDAAEPVILEADGGRLHDVFLNLVSNAVKFTGPGGAVSVVAELEPRPGASPGPMHRQVRIDVIDTGIGIPLDEQELIFQKFHRIAGPAYPGTGLGLAIAREYVARHGGSLTVESTVGLGSCFSVILPLTKAAVSAA